jgi:hypothetical protein
LLAAGNRYRRLRCLLGDHRPEVQLGGLSQGASLVTILSGHRNDQIEPVEHDFGPAHADVVDPLLDDLPSLVEGLRRGRATVQGPSGESHPGATLEVDAQLRGGAPAPGEEDQRVQDGNDSSEDRQVAPGAEAPGWWCHGGWFSSFTAHKRRALAPAR